MRVPRAAAEAVAIRLVQELAEERIEALPHRAGIYRFPTTVGALDPAVCKVPEHDQDAVATSRRIENHGLTSVTAVPPKPRAGSGRREPTSPQTAGANSSRAVDEPGTNGPIEGYPRLESISEATLFHAYRNAKRHPEDR